MHRISFPYFIGGADRLKIQDFGTDPSGEEGLTITFPIITGDPSPREAIAAIREQIDALGITWMTTDGSVWTFDLDQLRQLTEELGGMSWLGGQITIEPETNWTHDLDEWLSGSERHLRFVVTRAELLGSGAIG